MAIVDSISGINKSEMPEAPNWVNKLLGPFNGFMNSIVSALRGKLTFYDNFYCEEKTFTYTNNVELQILLSIIKKYRGFLLAGTPPDQFVTAIKVREIDNKTVGVTVQFSGGGTTTGNVKIIFWG